MEEERKYEEKAAERLHEKHCVKTAIQQRTGQILWTSSSLFLTFRKSLKKRGGEEQDPTVYFLGRLGGVSDPPQIFAGNLGRWGGSVFPAGL